MKHVALALILGITLVFGAVATAQLLSEAEKKAGFISLFDGETLNGWTIEGATENDWGVKDGAIGCSGARSWLRSDFEYDNFVLRVQWRFLKKGGNSGVYVRTSAGLGMKVPPSDGTHQVQTFDGAPAGMIFLGGVNAKAKPNDLLKPANPEGGEWNEFEITCDGAKISVKLNGEEVSSTDQSQLTRGFIGFEGEGAPIEFRNVRIKELGFAPLCSDANLTGWKYLSPHRPKWEFKDGVMKNVAGNSSDVLTEKEFGDFELRCEFLLPVEGGRNSGIYLRERYEIQILDDFGKPPANNGNGSLYRRKAADKNASRKLGEWQSLDIILVGDKLTIWLNGQKIHDRVSVSGGGTGSRSNLPDAPKGRILLQGTHGPILFRNLRIRELKS
jgi:hypothetical protein